MGKWILQKYVQKAEFRKEVIADVFVYAISVDFLTRSDRYSRRTAIAVRPGRGVVRARGLMESDAYFFSEWAVLAVSMGVCAWW